jgi:hypothetical protein
MLTAADATIAELAQLSTGLGFQKGVELSQALNTFPEAIAQGFAHHQQATMGGHMSGLEGFRRRLAEITASHSAPALPASQPMALLEGTGADPESLQD